MPVQKVISNCDADGMVKAKTTQKGVHLAKETSQCPAVEALPG